MARSDPGTRWCPNCADRMDGVNQDGTCPNDCGTVLDRELAAEHLEDWYAAERERAYDLASNGVDPYFGGRVHSSTGYSL